MAADPATLAEIARASAIINRQKLGLQPLQAPQYSHPLQYGSARGRGRGRGRVSVASRSVTFSQPFRGNNTWVAPAQQPVATSSGASSSIADHTWKDNAHPAVAQTSVTCETVDEPDVDLAATLSPVASTSTSLPALSPLPLVNPLPTSTLDHPAALATSPILAPAAVPETGASSDAKGKAAAVAEPVAEESEEGEISDDGRPPNAVYVATQLAAQTAAAVQASKLAAASPIFAPVLQYSHRRPSRRDRKALRNRNRSLRLDSHIQSAPSPSLPTVAGSASREVVIDGTTFVSDSSGRKLTRKSHNDISQSTNSTPMKASVQGQSFVRTKSGNLVALEYVKRKELEARKKRLLRHVNTIKQIHQARSTGNKSISTAPCRYYQRTGAPLLKLTRSQGVCTRGLTCPYKHNPDKVAICPKWLRSKCNLTASACPLSHQPDPHRMPHCLHFPSCRNGSDCIYPHVHLAADAKVCKDFVKLGWCERGLDCTERHVWECPEFSEKGTCSTKGCKLPHVIRRRGASEQDPSALADADLFIADVLAEARQQQQGTDSDEEVEAALLARPAKKRSTSSDDEGSAPVKHGKRQRHDPLSQNDDFITLLLSDSDDGMDEDSEVGESDAASTAITASVHSMSSSEESEDEDSEVGDETVQADMSLDA